MKHLLRTLAAAFAVLLLSTLLALGAHLFSELAPPAELELAADAGWGSEALLSAHDEGLAHFPSPIALANACGLGASSCVRCHDGKRAEAPPSAPDTSPWHADHAKVAYSCVGCHQGNPRVLRQDVAHKNLIVQPLAPTLQCGSCHAAGELPALAARYAPLAAKPTSPTP